MTGKIMGPTGEPPIIALLNFHAVKQHFQYLFMFIAIDFFFATLSSENPHLAMGSGDFKGSKLV